MAVKGRNHRDGAPGFRLVPYTFIDGWQGRCVEMTPLEGPERGGNIGALGSGCVFLKGSLVHTGAFSLTVIPGRMTIRFPAVDEHTFPG